MQAAAKSRKGSISLSKPSGPYDRGLCRLWDLEGVARQLGT